MPKDCSGNLQNEPRLEGLFMIFLNRVDSGLAPSALDNGASPGSTRAMCNG